MKISIQGRYRTKFEKLVMNTLLFRKKLELLRFDMDEEEITMRFGDGSTRRINQGQFNASFNRAMYVSMGRYVTIRTPDGQKFSFLEKLVKYQPEEFETIIELLGAQESQASDVAMSLLEVAKRFKKR